MGDVANMVGNRITEIEYTEGEHPFFPPMECFKEHLANKIDVGGGEQIQVPFVKSKYTVAVAEDYKQSTTKQDVDLTGEMTFAYQYTYFDIYLYMQEALKAKNRDGGKSYMQMVDFRIKEAGKAQRLKIHHGLFQGDGSASTVFAGYQSFWYDTTYGTETRATYGPRLDAAAALTKLNGGNGTKYTDPVAADGSSILDWLGEVYWASSTLGDAVKWIFMDYINYAKVRRAQGKEAKIVNLNELNKNAGTGKPPQPGLEFEHAYIVPLPIYNGTDLESGFITRGHVFGINPAYVGIPAVEGMEMDKIKPLAEVPSESKIGAIDLQFMASGRVITNKPTAHFWGTEVGK